VSGGGGVTCFLVVFFFLWGTFFGMLMCRYVYNDRHYPVATDHRLRCWTPEGLAFIDAGNRRRTRTNLEPTLPNLLNRRAIAPQTPQSQVKRPAIDPQTHQSPANLANRQCNLRAVSPCRRRPASSDVRKNKSHCPWELCLFGIFVPTHSFHFFVIYCKTHKILFLVLYSISAYNLCQKLS
jgi:hypothetical protein